jgi:hypothetical protein
LLGGALLGSRSAQLGLKERAQDVTHEKGQHTIRSCCCMLAKSEGHTTTVLRQGRGSYCWVVCSCSSKTEGLLGTADGGGRCRAATRLTPGRPADANPWQLAAHIPGIQPNTAALAAQLRAALELPTRSPCTIAPPRSRIARRTTASFMFVGRAIRNAGTATHASRACQHAHAAVTAWSEPPLRVHSIIANNTEFQEVCIERWVT